MIFYFNQTAFEAYVTVTWAAGGTCTISNGNLSYVAPNTSGSHTFTVEEEGTWTATVVSNGRTFTGSTSITESGQSNTISVDCRLFLFNGGDVTNLTGGWAMLSPYGDNYGGTDSTIHPGNAVTNKICYFTTRNNINLIGYRTLNAQFLSLNFGGGYSWNVGAIVGLSKTVREGGPYYDIDYNNTFVSFTVTKSNGNQLLSLDLSGWQVNTHYVSIYFGCVTGYCNQVWLAT